MHTHFARTHTQTHTQIRSYFRWIWWSKTVRDSFCILPFSRVFSVVILYMTHFAGAVDFSELTVGAMPANPDSLAIDSLVDGID